MEPSCIRVVLSKIEAILYVMICASALHVTVCARNMQLAQFRLIFDPAGLRLHGAAWYVEPTSICDPMSVLPRVAWHQSEVAHDSPSCTNCASRLSWRTSTGVTARYSRWSPSWLISRIVRSCPRTLSLPWSLWVRAGHLFFEQALCVDVLRDFSGSGIRPRWLAEERSWFPFEWFSSTRRDCVSTFHMCPYSLFCFNIYQNRHCVAVVILQYFIFCCF